MVQTRDKFGKPCPASSCDLSVDVRRKVWDDEDQEYRYEPVEDGFIGNFASIFAAKDEVGEIPPLIDLKVIHK